MLLRIFTIMVVCTLVIFLIFWVVTGGLSRGIKTARSLNNPLEFFLGGSATGTSIKFPWQPDFSSFGASTETETSGETIGETVAGMLPDSTYGEYTDSSDQNSLADLENQYGELSAQAREARTFGSPSPYRGVVTFVDHETDVDTAAHEYLSLQVTASASNPQNLAGWSLQSLVSGLRIPIPPAASMFVLGSINEVAPVVLANNGTIHIISGVSPVSVSFQENICTGYLAERQAFSPALDTTCPDPADSLPLTPENLQIYGETCIDFVRNMPSCHFPGPDVTDYLRPACKNYVVNEFSYNGCVYAHRTLSSFNKNSWRLYLASNSKLWRAGHDIIRLLDDQGRTVDVLTY